MWKTGSKSPPRRTASVWGPLLCRWHSEFLAPTHPPVGQKTSLVNFKHKITTSANYTDGIGTGYTSHDNEMCLHITDLKNYSKSINKIGPVLMPWWNVWGGGVKKRRFFPPKTSYKLGSGVERGEQVGFWNRKLKISIKNYGNENFAATLLLHNLLSATHPPLPSARRFFNVARQCFFDMKTNKESYFSILSFIILRLATRILHFFLCGSSCNYHF